ncbi:MAG: DNA replication/repair protein RecF [Pseudomonadota bacterium]
MDQTRAADAIGSQPVERVAVRRLKLSNFRSYSSLSAKFDQRHVVLTGANGAGKTNLLEALSFLSPGRGVRRATHDQVARASAKGGDGTFAVHVELDGIGGPVSIGTGIEAGPSGPEAGRRLRINGAAANASERLLDHLRAIWLTPAMDGLFMGPASDRRRFLDRLVLALDPLHARRVNDFDKAMRARNRLLEDVRPDPAWLTSVEGQMAELGAAIVAGRLEFTAALAGMVGVAADVEGSPFPTAELALAGTLEAQASQISSGELEDAYRVALTEGRQKDRAAGRTLEGPHRSDLVVHHRAKEMPAALCSTGEQKALLIGVTLAHARLVAQSTGAAPLLLLDEIAAHLDPERRAALFSLIDALGGQAWLTGTDGALFEAMGDRAQHFRVEDDALVERDAP